MCCLDLNFWEKLFIFWVGLWGIVVVGIVLFFGLMLMLENLLVEDVEFLVLLVFMIVLGMVFINVIMACFIVKVLKVMFDSLEGIFIVGVNGVSCIIG